MSQKSVLSTVEPAGALTLETWGVALFVLSALKRDGWVEIRRKGSHVTLEKAVDGSAGRTTMAKTWAIP